MSDFELYTQCNYRTSDRGCLKRKAQDNGCPALFVYVRAAYAAD